MNNSVESNKKAVILHTRPTYTTHEHVKSTNASVSIQKDFTVYKGYSQYGIGVLRATGHCRPVLRKKEGTK